MTRYEYIKKLEEALYDVPQAEKVEALQYYNDYFDDAGAENEQEVIRSLGTPEKLAETIRKEHVNKSDMYSDDTYMGSDEKVGSEKKKLSGGVIALIVVLTILASPVLLGLAAALFGIIIGILASVFGIIIALLAVVIALVAVAVSCIIAAVTVGAGTPFLAIILGGAGIFVAGITIFLVMLIVWLFGKVFPWLFRGIGKLFKKIFGKKGER